MSGGRWDYPLWSAAGAGAEVRFVGRGPSASRRRVLESVEGVARDVAWATQKHSAGVLEAREGGHLGAGDALFTRRPGQALCVVTADCVPVVVAGTGAVAVVHAGWRGIVAGVVAQALAALGAGAQAMAWIGPAIGPCCYEVGDDVADRVVAASTAGCRVDPPEGRPRLDLAAAVEHQLLAVDVTAVRRLGPCTRCSPELWSYRRDGTRAGRNLTFAWLSRLEDTPTEDGLGGAGEVG